MPFKKKKKSFEASSVRQSSTLSTLLFCQLRLSHCCPGAHNYTHNCRPCSAIIYLIIVFHWGYARLSGHYCNCENVFSIDPDYDGAAIQLSLSTNILHMCGHSQYSAVPAFQHGIMKPHPISLQRTAGCVHAINTCMYWDIVACMHAGPL